MSTQYTIKSFIWILQSKRELLNILFIFLHQESGSDDSVYRTSSGCIDTIFNGETSHTSKVSKAWAFYLASSHTRT